MEIYKRRQTKQMTKKKNKKANQKTMKEQFEEKAFRGNKIEQTNLELQENDLFCLFSQKNKKHLKTQKPKPNK